MALEPAAISLLRKISYTKIEMVKNLMSNMKWTLEQTLNNMGVSDNERSIITKQLQK